MLGVPREYLLAGGIGAFLLYYLYYKISDASNLSNIKIPQRNFSLQDLSLYNGEGQRLCYVAFGDAVYDVSGFKAKFAALGLGGRALDCLTWKELEEKGIKVYELDHDLGQNNLNKVGMTRELLEKCNKMGTLLRPKAFTLAELKKFDGRNGMPVYICALGNIYQVSKDFYGPDGPYGIMAGRDASRALALHSLNMSDIDNRSITDLTWSQRNDLNEWVMKFEQKYPKVGFLSE